MLRARFLVIKKKCGGDYRPVKWPIKHPYWCTGETSDDFILVAYADSIKELKELWPEARDIDSEDRDEITFTSRFPKPKWYIPKDKKDNEPKFYVGQKVKINGRGYGFEITAVEKRDDCDEYKYKLAGWKHLFRESRLKPYTGP